MDTDARFEAALDAAIESHLERRCPAGLAEAIRYAVFPGGHRIRPKICLAVARACKIDDPAIAFAAAAGLEVMHCASLVHDDMPCFDDAAMRRGKPSVHARFGDALALLTGDALIVLAFQLLADGAGAKPDRLCELMKILGSHVGVPGGIVAGQAWECESDIDIRTYHRAKTGALFAAATMSGAAAAGRASEEWSLLGERIGEAYQVADDLLDNFGDPATIGKPVGRDAENGCPNCVTEYGADKVTRRLKKLVRLAEDSVPDCPGRADLVEAIREEAQGFVNLALGRRQAA